MFVLRVFELSCHINQRGCRCRSNGSTWALPICHPTTGGQFARSRRPTFIPPAAVVCFRPCLCRPPNNLSAGSDALRIVGNRIPCSHGDGKVGVRLKQTSSGCSCSANTPQHGTRTSPALHRIPPVEPRELVTHDEGILTET